jgi:hypothetical protein
MSSFYKYIHRFAIDFPRKGVFYGFNNSDFWEYDTDVLNTKGDWHIRLGVLKNTLFVNGATEYHPYFKQAVKNICNKYLDYLNYEIHFDGPNIKVSDFLNTHYPNKIEQITFLHGTSSNLLSSILMNGLLPRNKTGVNPSYGVPSGSKEGIDTYIYLSTQMNMIKFASYDAIKTHGGNPITLQINPGLRASYAKPDEDSGENTALMSLWTMGSIAYTKAIPPNKIKMV